jgi:hypothetical protein
MSSVPLQFFLQFQGFFLPVLFMFMFTCRFVFFVCGCSTLCNKHATKSKTCLVPPSLCLTLFVPPSSLCSRPPRTNKKKNWRLSWVGGEGGSFVYFSASFTQSTITQTSLQCSLLVYFSIECRDTQRRGVTNTA